MNVLKKIKRFMANLYRLIMLSIAGKDTVICSMPDYGLNNVALSSPDSGVAIVIDYDKMAANNNLEPNQFRDAILRAGNLYCGTVSINNLDNDNAEIMVRFGNTQNNIRNTSPAREMITFKTEGK